MKIFGILNLTPDSFSGSNNIADASQLIADGADYIDIGAESTRPGAVALSPEEEWQRLEPALSTLSFPRRRESLSDKIPACAGMTDIELSIDTYHPETFEKALGYNSVKFLNDVSGLCSPKMVQLAASSGIKVIVMHSLTVPADKNVVLTTPVIPTLKNWLVAKLAVLNAAGIKTDNVIFDPGLGFGKTAEQSREIVENAPELATFCHNLGVKILYGHSRKSFIGGDVSQRDLETARITGYLKGANVDYVRVHNVKLNREKIK